MLQGVFEVYVHYNFVKIFFHSLFCNADFPREKKQQPKPQNQEENGFIFFILCMASLNEVKIFCESAICSFPSSRIDIQLEKHILSQSLDAEFVSRICFDAVAMVVN